MAEAESDSLSPTRCGGHSIVTQEEGQEDPSIKAMGYFDIMILGLTGQGKTTTADKLLIANPDHIDYAHAYPSSAHGGGQASVLPKAAEARYQDLSMWLIPSDQFSLERISTRMKNLAFYRILQDPHLEVNAAHDNNMRVTERTLKCELFSNEKTKVRVLDVPGFFGAMTAEQFQANVPEGRSPTTTTSIMEDTHATHIRSMRRILHTQTIMKMKFNRILYFLPCRGPLSIISAALQQELQLLVYYFGRHIFDTIVLVATLDGVTYNIVPEGIDVIFPVERLESSRRRFHEALKIFIPEDTPNPPIIFISLRETCESILEKVKATQVIQEGLQLELNPTLCSRCGVTIGEKNGERLVAVKRYGWLKNVSGGFDWSDAIPYEHSRCHPVLVPRFNRGQKLTEGIAYTIRAVVHREWNWPDLNVEKCLNCNAIPGTEGCLKVGSKYKEKLVDHTNRVEGYAHRELNQRQSKTSGPSESNSESKEDSIGSVNGIERLPVIEQQSSDASLASEGSVFGQEGDNNPSILSESSEGFITREVSVYIEPEHSPQASMRLNYGNKDEQRRSPETESNESEKKGT
ncbi:uncharacterized protein LOC135338197 [Halichondria panicea]|uniref:uncharacterized protein LOC135338197 n=1 Tax=Halichondria panicea TaxID=6063 RepID=UPI00312B8142